MNEIKLRNYAKAFLETHFGLTLTIPIERNNRLRSSYGRFVYQENKQPLRIEIAGLLFDYANEEIIYSVLKHECIHYALFSLDKPYHDGHPYFEALLKEHGAAATNTLKVGKYIVYACSSCEQEYETRIKQVAKTPQKYRTLCCQSPIYVKGQRIFHGNES